MSDSAADVAVALLYDTRERGAHLREALAAFGAPIVYEAPTHSLDREALERSQANVVVVNLDAQQEPDLDDVYGLLADERYRVVFNDGDVSSTLSGWDQARWARHLAAKILGADVDPPRPADAEPVPAATVRPIDVDAHATSAAVPSATAGPAVATLDEEAAAPIAVDHDEPVDAVTLASDLALDSDWSVAAAGMQGHAEQTAAAAEPLSLDLDDLIEMPEVPRHEGLSVSFDDDLDESPLASTPAAAGTEPSGTVALDDIDQLLAHFDAAVEASAEPAPADAFTAYDFELDTVAEAPAPTPPAAPPVVPAGFALTLDPIDFDEEGTAAAAPTPPPAVSPAQPVRDESPAIAVPTQWSLEDMLDDLGEAPPAPPPSGPAQFGIEKLSAEEFLSPPAEESAAPAAVALDSPDFSFELIPIEEAVSPTQVQSVAHENWMEKAEAPKARVRRVWVLGASIGGPESVREFLAEIPRDYPALFLLAQHLGGEFVDMMTRQLAKATPLTVRTPSHGERVGHGEVIVVPTNHRLLVDAEGVVVLEKNPEQTPYSPSIDQVLRDVADRFGAGAGAIVFSGMSTDALEGCRYLTEKGGVVYAQDPDTCVVSSMVDGVVEAGLVALVASPKELAERLLAEPK